MLKNLSAYDKTQVCESEIDRMQLQQNFIKTPEKSILKQCPQNEKKDMISNFSNSMDMFCSKFYEDYHQSNEKFLNIKEVTEKYRIKNRRVYDLMGILEGFGCVQKLKKKGTYIWTGINYNKYNFEFHKNSSVSLKDISGLIKLLLINCKQGLTIKELNQKVIKKVQEKTSKSQNKLTMNRRIYECLKVMKTFNFVVKQQTAFVYTFGRTPQKCIQNQIKKQHSNQMRDFSKSDLITQSQKSVLKRVIKKLGPENFNHIVSDLSGNDSSLSKNNDPNQSKIHIRL